MSLFRTLLPYLVMLFKYYAKKYAESSCLQSIPQPRWRSSGSLIGFDGELECKAVYDAASPCLSGPLFPSDFLHDAGLCCLPLPTVSSHIIVSTHTYKPNLGPCQPSVSSQSTTQTHYCTYLQRLYPRIPETTAHL